MSLSLLYRILKICLLALGLVIFAGTIYGVFFRTPAGHTPAGQLTTPFEGGEGQTFTGIGRLRIPTADPQPGMVMLFVSFIYYPEDRAFSEELVLRIRDFREIITDYIGSLSVADLQRLDEEGIKAEILRRINAILRLGRIETLFFSDFMIIR